MFLWWLLSLVYVVSYVFLLIFVITDLFRDESAGGWVKALWIIFLIFVPFLTGIVYVIARGDGMAARAAAVRGRAPEDDDYRPAASATPDEDIARAQRLLDAGTISQGEFEALKSKALGNRFYGA
ncbi:SHOCT domain-containing protein [Microbacterium fluvii]|uniref:SHOCT domain-containing protein n=1 Tax=Microbacterium fluvii TaxID=415215 RepID=A0ABW2HF88_9MICO|nr:SHOCT domain-containing protein [Microbacterium fluvii]MCU4672062.1 SHOCT domain-containing protein [Microbacterium fluvii]